MNSWKRRCAFSGSFRAKRLSSNATRVPFIEISPMASDFFVKIDPSVTIFFTARFRIFFAVHGVFSATKIDKNGGARFSRFLGKRKAGGNPLNLA